MTVTSPNTQSNQRAWTNGILPVAKEFAPTSLPILAGAVPAGLRGTLYRNGPGRLERGGKRVGHWFDGDGAILAVRFSDADPVGLYRYIQTAGYLAESEAGQFLYSNYGMTEPGPLWNHWWKMVMNEVPAKNTANTSLLALPDKLLALWEGGKPHAIDLTHLNTLGIDSLNGLADDQPYSAHPQRDPVTGEIFNMGVSAGPNPKLNVYKSDRTGRIVKKTAIPLDGIPLVHSFVLAGQYLVFFVPPVRLNVLPVLVGVSSYSDALEWKANQSTRIFVVDRDTLDVVSQGETEPWFQWHFGNGCVADGLITLDFARHPDFTRTNQYLKEVASGETHTASPSQLWQVRLDPKTAKIKSLQEVVSRNCEFPVVPPAQVGQPWRYTFLSVHHADAEISREIFGSIARYDYQTDTLTVAELGDHRYPMEPLYAADALHPERGWILTVVFDGNNNTSEVWIFDSDRLNDAPVCRIGLPEVVPMGFHGTWNPAA
ncbi:carotenoid oxygenase family protein [Oculatella sp. LEGE 06141]|uniref:carotenoid oxygenase family protein n=1 Tax=Oculatella sp. LEGE 06141 TaxID=1828648 RepID=UPI001881F597|nr:carotenoid oxygenase family protein [Oculatella sp. LEGE 06141]MBE9182168.1 carotenoid oxygenase family protein [Oculatella sp. LEGE 06141]